VVKRIGTTKDLARGLVAMAERATDAQKEEMKRELLHFADKFSEK
jgi:hypothetical protein